MSVVAEIDLAGTENSQNDNSGHEEEQKCTVCNKTFPGIQAVMRHELYVHTKKTTTKKSSKMLNSFLEAMNNESHVQRRQQLHEALSNCTLGTELETILHIYTISNEDINIIFDHVQKSFNKVLAFVDSRVSVHIYGSFASNLTLKDGDIDLYIESLNQRDNEATQWQLFNKICRALRYRDSNFQNVTPIRNARVPIIKCQHTTTGFNLDINTSCPSSIYNTSFIHDLVKFDSRIRKFLLLLKIWAKELQLISQCTMTSYCFVMLALFYLQQPLWQYPDVHTSTVFSAKRLKGNNSEIERQKKSQKAINQQLRSILPSIEQLQQTVPVYLVRGINFSYDLSHMQPLPKELNVYELISGFFLFYEYFDFETNIISLYLGKSIPLADFHQDRYNFPQYECQLQMMTDYATSNQCDNNVQQICGLNTAGIMCVQDPFALNHNIARRQGHAGFAYFRQCLRLAGKVCREGQWHEYPREFCQSLITKMPAKVTEIMPNVIPNKRRPEKALLQSDNNVEKIVPDTGNQQTYMISISRAEFRALEIYAKGQHDIHKYWAQQYQIAIHCILTEIYQLDVKCVTTNSLEPDIIVSPQVWFCCSCIDTWTGRQHHRTQKQTFMENQLEQTLRLLEARHSNSAYKTRFNGVMTLNIEPITANITIGVAPQRPSGIGLFVISKNHPLRRFFSMFKATLQNYSLREQLDTERFASRAALLNAIAKIKDTHLPN